MNLRRIKDSGMSYKTLLQMELQCASDEQKEFIQSKLDSCKPVKITRLRDIFTDEEIETIVRSVRPEVKGCYRNAMLFLGTFPGRVQYCEGYFECCGLPIEHAFNLIDGKYYVDITRELALLEDPDTVENDTTYVCYGVYDSKTVWDSYKYFDYCGDVFTYVFRKSHHK